MGAARGSKPSREDDMGVCSARGNTEQPIRLCLSGSARNHALARWRIRSQKISPMGRNSLGEASNAPQTFSTSIYHSKVLHNITLV